MTATELIQEHPQPEKTDHTLFGLHISVFPAKDQVRHIRFRIYQTMLDDGAPFIADISFALSPDKAVELANELQTWLQRKEDDPFTWKSIDP